MPSLYTAKQFGTTSNCRAPAARRSPRGI